MTINTKSMRIDAMNMWPAKFQFPFERDISKLLAKHNFMTPITTCRIKNNDDHEYHRIVSSILDGLDSLPERPDRSFESLWIPIDVEMERLKVPNVRGGKFKAFVDHLRTAEITNGIRNQLFLFLENAPLQACEYAAIRILEAIDNPGEHSEGYLARVRVAVGTDFAQDFATKYLPRIKGYPADVVAAELRKAGSFIRNIMRGRVMTLEGHNYGTDPYGRLAMFSSVVLPNIRNERFHGNVFSSYRSSLREMKHYASDCFISALAYSLILIVLAYRWPDAVDQAELENTLQSNTERFQILFRQQLGA